MSTLERLKELETKATPGPWFGRPGMLSNAVNVHAEGQSVIGALCVEDADLVITLRNALPKILAVVDAIGRLGLKCDYEDDILGYGTCGKCKVCHVNARMAEL